MWSAVSRRSGQTYRRDGPRDGVSKLKIRIYLAIGIFVVAVITTYAGLPLLLPTPLRSITSPVCKAGTTTCRVISKCCTSTDSALLHMNTVTTRQW